MTSKLSQMQARFQQKQMQEKEEKLLRLYENQQQRTIERVNRGSAGSTTSVTSVTSMTSTQGGKVRQMFDERRQKAGIDRSYPLEPLKTRTNGYTKPPDKKNDTVTKSSSKIVKTTVQRSVTHIKNEKPIVNKREIVGTLYNNNNGNESYEEHYYQDDNANKPVLNKTYRQKDLEIMMNNHRIHNLDDEEFPDVGIDDIDEPIVKPRLANVGGKLPSQNGVVKKPVEEKVYIKNGYTPEKQPAASKKEPMKTGAKRVVSKTASSPTAPSPGAKPSKTSSSPVQKVKSENMHPSHSSPAKSTPRKSDRTPSTARPSSKQGARGSSAVNRDDLEACRFCNRRFAGDRLGVHEDICAKTMKKKRKTYDATKHRVEGTELEQYTRKTKATSVKASGKAGSAKNNWRQKHEEFISAIRAAKMAQAHVAKGGKLSDLPPPPPSSNPDYVQCPHCGRRFNAQAAERHIPKCATYEFNKPKQARAGKTGSNKLR